MSPKPWLWAGSFFLVLIIGAGVAGSSQRAFAVWRFRLWIFLKTRAGRTGRPLAALYRRSIGIAVKVLTNFQNPAEPLRASHCADVRRAALQKRTCACRKSNPNILVMQPAQDWKAKNTPCPLNRAR